MKRIAILVPDVNFTGGAEHVAINLANLLVEEYHVTLVSLFSKKTDTLREKETTVNIIHLNLKKKIELPFRLINLIKNTYRISEIYSNFDFVIGNNTFRYFVLPFFYGKCKLIEIQHLRYEEGYKSKNKIQLLIRNYIYKRLYKVIALTDRDGRLFHNAGLKNIVVIPNFIPEIEPIKQFNNHKNNILIVGRLTEQKNHISLLRAWYLVKSCLKNQNLKLHIAGDGPQLENLKNFSHEFNLEESIIFHGNINDMRELYSNASMLVSTSLYEGFPLVFLEALNYSLPILTYNFNSGANQLVINNYNGLVSPLGDELALAKNIERLANDEKLRYCMSMNAKKYRLEFSAENIKLTWKTKVLGE